ncbi:MAG: YdeI/OmpD-associated family protein [Chitinophagaceae bacterium]
MVEFISTILQYAEQGDKTGWTYIEIPADIAQQVFPGNKKTFRVMGQLDEYRFKGINLLPIGGGRFMMPLNATLRKNIHKRRGGTLEVRLQADLEPVPIPGWMIDCLADEPSALAYFNKLPRAHQNYFIKWVESAKTEPTRIKRISQTVTAFLRGLDFGAMIRINRE